jgi:hypothetical protein
MRKAIAVIALALALTSPTFAGIMQCGIDDPPPPPPSETSTAQSTETATTLEVALLDVLALVSRF